MMEDPPTPTKRPIDDEIASIKAHLQEMGEWSIQMVSDGMAALGAGDAELARKVVAKDDRLDAFDVDIEHEVIRVLVTRQPAARDARTLGACLKVGTYLDRVGRLGLDIAKYVRQSPSKEQFPPWAILLLMQDQAVAMLRVALDAFDRGDVEKARAVYEADDAVDELNRQVIKGCIVGLESEPLEPPQLVAYVLVSRHLERVADNACKIAEKTIYMETGHRRREFLTADNKVAL
jgi:phosphate transport system protein